MSDDNDADDLDPKTNEGAIRPENIRAVRLGHGANCSSVGSVIDTLFLASAVGGAIFAAVCAALNDEPPPTTTTTQEAAHDEDAGGDHHANAS